MSDTRRYAVWPETRSRSLKGSRPSVPHGTNFILLLLLLECGDDVQERTTDDSKESECLKQLLSARTHEYIEEVLQPHFGGMIAFVKECEVAVERGNVDSLRAHESQSLGPATTLAVCLSLCLFMSGCLSACQGIIYTPYWGWYTPVIDINAHTQTVLPDWGVYCSSGVFVHSIGF